jgi:hypothetical protein
VLRLGESVVATDERRLPRTIGERRALDARLVKAATALDPASFSTFSATEPSEEHRLLARIAVRSEVDWVGRLPAAMLREHAFKDPIVDEGVRVAPLVAINEISPTGTCELRLMNYDIGERRLDALIKAESFAELSRAVTAAVPPRRLP